MCRSWLILEIWRFFCCLALFSPLKSFSERESEVEWNDRGCGVSMLFSRNGRIKKVCDCESDRGPR